MRYIRTVTPGALQKPRRILWGARFVISAHPRTRGWAALVLLVLLAALLAPAAGVSAAKPNGPTKATGTTATFSRIQAGLVSKARAQGTVRVIVNLRARLSTSAMSTKGTRTRYTRNLAVRTDRVAHLARTTGGSVARRFVYLPSIVLYATPRTIAALRASPDVASVAADRLGKPTLNESVPIVQGNRMASAGWGGTNEIVAVLDTGVQADHPFLAGKAIDGACFASGDGTVAGNCPNGLATQAGDVAAAAPCTWALACLHGTHVAGIAVGKRLAGAGPGGVSIAGVARNASLLPIQVFSNFLASDGTTHTIGSWTSDQAAGLEYVYGKELAGAYAPRHVASANLSIGGGGTATVCDGDPDEAPIENAANLLRTLGVATVYAAGNDYYVNATSYPGCLSTVITVSSTTKTDHVSDFSDIATWVDVAAPGTGIYSSIPGSAYEVLDGTSMAAPHVSGAWAEIKSRFPHASVNIVTKALQVTGKQVTDDRVLSDGSDYTHLTKSRIKILSAGDWLGTTRTSLEASASKVSSGRHVTITATARRQHNVGQKPTGRLRLKVNGVTVGTVTIDPVTGKAVFSVKVTGPHGAKISIVAYYRGDGPFLKSNSSVLKITIK